MKKIILGILAMFLVAIMAGSVSADPEIVGIIPNQNMNEDCAPWALDLANPLLSYHENGITPEFETDAQLEWSVSGDTLFTPNFDLAKNIITFTPIPNAYGTDTITLTLTSTIDSAFVSQDIDVILTAEDDPAEWNEPLDDKAVNEDSADGTVVYSNLKDECIDIDSSKDFTVTSTDTHYELYFLGDNLAIKNLEANYYSNEGKTVNLVCNGISASFKLTITAVNDDAPEIVGTIPDQTKDEDTAPWALDLSAYEKGINGEDDLDLDWSVSGVDTLKFTTSFDFDLNIITFTPVENIEVTDTITLTLTSTVASKSVSQDIKLTLSEKNDAPIIVGTIPDQNEDEDCDPWTLDLSGYESDEEDFDLDLDWSVSNVDTSKFTTSFDSDLNVITFTPIANAYGIDTITLTLTDSGGKKATQDIKVTLDLDSTDDAPTVVEILDQKWVKGESKVLYLTEYFNDPDGASTLTYTWESTDLEDITVTVANSIATFTPKVDTWRGTNKIKFTATDGVHDPVTSNEFKLVVRNLPEFLCEEGECGDLSIDIDEPEDDGDEFKPGETIDIDVDVSNDGSEDIDDVVVEIFLVDETDDEIIESVKSDSQEIKDGDDETFNLELVVPSNGDIDEGHDYVLYIKAYEKGKEDDHCRKGSRDIDIERDSHDVIITSYDVTPTLVNPGETIEFTFDIENIGTTDEDDVVIKLTEADLGLDLESNMFDLDDFEGDDNTQTIRFTFTVPSNIVADTYDINVGVYDEDDDIFDASDDSGMFVSFVVSGSAVTVTDEVSITASDVPKTVDADKSYSIPIKVTNNKAVQDTFTVKLTNIDDWATSTSEKVLTLKAGQSETVYMYFKANEGVGEGKYSATVQVTDNLGNIVGTETVTVGAEDKGSIFGDFSFNTVFYIIGYLVLIIVAIFFIKLIFSRGKGKVKEVRL